jgi:hypothetical protein
MQQDLAFLLGRAVKDLPPGLEFLPMNTVITDGARINAKRHAWLKFHCPDGWVLNMRGNEKLRDLYVTTRIPREYVEAVRVRVEKEKELKQENAEPQPTAE